MRTRNILVAASIVAAIVGCRTPSDAPGGPTPSPSISTTPQVPPTSAQTTLDTFDKRTPVPLLPMMANHQKQNMRDHLAAVQEITAGINANDFPAIEHAAARMGFSEQMGQMCTHMGAGAPGFTERALHFHHTADTIVGAAKQKDMKAVLTALDTTLTTCTSCHATFKQQVVDDATWASLTKQAAPTGPMHP